MKKSEKILLVLFAILFGVIVGGGLLTYSLKSYRSMTEGNDKLRARLDEMTRNIAQGAEWQGRSFRLVDTGGWLPGGDALDEKVSRQSERAIDEADAILLVVDVTTGVTEEDARVGELLRTRSKAIAQVADVFTEGVVEVCEGQAYDKEFELMHDVSVEDYLLMIAKKTGKLFSVSS